VPSSKSCRARSSRSGWLYAVQVPGGGEQLIVDGAALQEQRDLGLGEAALDLLGRRKHAPLAERGTQEVAPNISVPVLVRIMLPTVEFDHDAPAG
jgi:hypothetical protein